MQVLYSRCAGLDVHKKTVVACRLATAPDGQVTKEIQTFGTTTAELLRLLDWLLTWPGGPCTHVAMESTGAYWKPVYNLLEGQVEILLVNAHHYRNVPAQKTDRKDAAWLADLLRHGLLKGSYVPARPQRELRDLTRARSVLAADRARVLNRLQQALEDANLKLGCVATEIDGVSCRAILAELVAGHTDPAVLAALAKGRLREKREALQQALTGRVRVHHRFLLAQYLAQLEFLEEQIAVFDAQITAHLEQMSVEGPPPPPPLPPGGSRRSFPPPDPPSYTRAVALVDPIPGIAVRGAQVLLAEIGVDMERWGTFNRLVAWAGLAPGNHESAGKRSSGRLRPGSPMVRKVMIQMAHGAIRTKDSYFGALYHRLAGRRGKKRALVAVARALLVVVYHVLLYQEPYYELGGNYFDERKRDAVVDRLKQRLEKLGYAVSLELLPAAA